MLKKLTATFVVLSFLLFSAPAFADDTMQRTLRDALYGGLIGGVLGLAVMLLTDTPEDHWDFVPTGAAIGILGGAAYGLATSDVVGSVAEYDGGELKFKLPAIRTYKVFDKISNTDEVVGKMDLFKFKF